MKKITLYIAATFILACVAFAASPFVTLLKIQSAIEARDGDKMAAHIDFPQLRSNLKAQLEGPAGDFIQKQGKSEIAGFFASLVGKFTVDSVVDTMVAPEGLNALMHGQTDLEKIKEGITSPTSFESQTKQNDSIKKSFNFTSLTEFHLTVTNDGQPPVTIVLSREAFTWKLSNIILPTTSQG